MAVQHRRRTRTRALRVLVATGAALGALGALAGPGGAQSVSTVAVTALPPGAVTKNQDAALNALGCWGTNSCAEVGSYRSTAGNEPLVAGEVDGTRVAPVTVALPANATASTASPPGAITELLGVACPAAGSCVAVGTYATTTGFSAMMVTESGGVWGAATPVALPTNAAPKDPSAALSAVACNGPGNCVAVGSYVTRGQNVLPLAISEHRGTWEPPVVPALPVGALSSEQNAALLGVSCPTFGNCAAAGTYVNATDFAPMVLTETAGVWGSSASAVTVALPADASTTGDDDDDALDAITCQSLRNCVGVGQYDADDAVVPFALDETAGTWPTAVPVAVPTLVGASGALVGTLSAVSCLNPVTCTAVGAYGTASDTLPLVATETAGAWAPGASGAVPTVPAMSGHLATETAVTCFKSGPCLVAGAYPTTAGTEPYLATPTTVPDPPTNLTVAVGNERLTLTWGTPSYTGRTAVTGYVAQVSPGAESCTTTTATTCVLTHLSDGTRYAITVVATNAVGDSAADAASGTPASRPAAPTIVSVQPLRGGFQIVLGRPLSDGGAPITAYQYSLDGGHHWRESAHRSTSRILDVAGLLRNHTYQLAARAVNVVGPGRRSPRRTATTR